MRARTNRCSQRKNQREEEARKQRAPDLESKPQKTVFPAATDDDDARQPERRHGSKPLTVTVEIKIHASRSVKRRRASVPLLRLDLAVVRRRCAKAFLATSSVEERQGPTPNGAESWVELRNAPAPE